jgi:putative toxin-antitoxin system antitoxin component (TIGR02293 family)
MLKKLNKEMPPRKTGARVITMRRNPRLGVIKWLGIPEKADSRIKSEFDYIQLSEEGITKASVIALADNSGISKKAMAEKILDISVKTLERKDPKSRFDRKISSHAIEIARVLEHAYEVFEDKEKVKGWIQAKNKALNDKKPVELFETLTGLNLVNDILGRIEEGVYS